MHFKHVHIIYSLVWSGYGVVKPSVVNSVIGFHFRENEDINQFIEVFPRLYSILLFLNLNKAE